MNGWRLVGVLSLLLMARSLALAAIHDWSDRALFWRLTNPANIAFAGAAYLFVGAMTATSFDRTAAWLAPRRWRLLHLVGGWYIRISFAAAVGKRVPLDRFYWSLAGLVLAAAIDRVIAMARRNRRRVALATTAR